MSLGVWIHPFCSDHVMNPKTVVASLEKANVVQNEFVPDALNGPGIVLFSHISHELCDFIQTLSRNGTKRILALAPDTTRLDNNDVWQVLHAGASDVLFWNDLPDPGDVIAARLKRWRTIDEIVESPLVSNKLIGQSRVWKSVLRRIVEVACFTDAPVLLTGETGTGKELAARLIHALSLKGKGKDLVILDCTTIVPELSGSELFGHERGAFTGAVTARDGAFATADGGTLFLDEVGELSLNLQIQLLRVLQERAYKRVGSNTWLKSDFRLLCATNRDLISEEKLGKFRRDLYYRIASCTINMPPLRNRTADIIPLVNHFISEALPDSELPKLDERVQCYFLTRNYPGNVRDLKNLIKRVIARHVGTGPITVGDIPQDERPDLSPFLDPWRDGILEQVVGHALSTGLKLKEIGRTVEETAIRMTVDHENGNLQSAASKLGVTDRTLQNWRARTRQQNLYKCAEK
ncbi:MAG: sigma-54-dependent Fis family transcriptional regulator [Anaerolineaceae bacterium]|nr:sigma-54-dependent Fis family transcriptional regulator [Anaerolineaceae bacterium]